MQSSPTARILRLWRRLGDRPGGRWLFALLLGRAVPYTGTLRARVQELTPGHARVTIRDRRGLRNHLQSIHAVALANLGELATGLAFTSGFPPDARGIPVRLSIEYLKKARGEITAECRCEPPAGNETRDYDIEASLRDQEGDAVARVTARWRVGPRE